MPVVPPQVSEAIAKGKFWAIATGNTSTGGLSDREKIALTAKGMVFERLPNGKYFIIWREAKCPENSTKR